MRLLVTGGAGYIGSTTAQRLLADGHDVFVLDDLRSGHRDLVPQEATFIHGDVADPTTYRDALDQIDACLHFAASAEAGLSMRCPEAFYSNNTAATARLLDALIKAGVRRVVFSSTCAVYGQPDRLPIDESADTAPTNVYGHSKLLVERMLACLAELTGLRYASLRYFNAAGASDDRGEDHELETHLIPRVLEVAAGRREAVEVLGVDYPSVDGTCIRDYVHVEDLAEAHVAALRALDEHSHVVCNLGTGHGYSVREIVDAARLVTGASIPIVERPRRPGDPGVLVASSERARSLLSWQPRRSSLEHIVASAWSWHTRRWMRRDESH